MGKMKRKTKKKLTIFIVLSIVVILGGVGYFFLKDNTGLKGLDVPDEPKKVVEPEKKVQVVDLDSKSRPYAVMINNNSAVWSYQSGLNDAYVVYEMLVEGGITREMALYKDASTEKIASVRSSRHYFLDYALENDAIYVHWGWSPKAQQDIKSLGVNNINGLTYEGKYFFRDKSIKGIGSEHKGYTQMSKLKEATEKLKYRTTTDKSVLLNYSVDALDMTGTEGVVDAKYVEVPYSGSYTAKFFYDEESKLYKKNQNKKEMVDYTSKERITTKNLILYNASYKTIDSYGRLDMSNLGAGDGYFITEGKAIPIKWEKNDRSSKTVYKLASGEELKVNDGNTYIGIMPTGRSAKISEAIPQ